MTDQAKGLLITTLGVLMIVPDSLFIRLISTDTITVVFWRSFLSGLAILIALIFLNGRGTLATFQRMGNSGLAYSTLLGISSVSFMVAIRWTSVANTVFIIATMPVFAALISRFWLGEPIKPRMVWTMIAVLTGIGVIISGSAEGGTSSLQGDFVALMAAASFAMAMTVARRAKGVSMVPAVTLSSLGVAALVFPFASPFVLSGNDPLYILLHGAVFIPVSMSLLAIGPRFITAPEVALLILLESVLAPIVVWLVLGENPGTIALIGGAIILGALAVSNYVALKRRKTAV